MNKDYTLLTADLSRMHPLAIITIVLLVLSIFTHGKLKIVSIFLFAVVIIIEAMLLWKET